MKISQRELIFADFLGLISTGFSVSVAPLLQNCHYFFTVILVIFKIMTLIFVSLKKGLLLIGHPLAIEQLSILQEKVHQETFS